MVFYFSLEISHHALFEHFALKVCKLLHSVQILGASEVYVREIVLIGKTNLYFRKHSLWMSHYLRDNVANNQRRNQLRVLIWTRLLGDHHVCAVGVNASQLWKVYTVKPQAKHSSARWRCICSCHSGGLGKRNETRNRARMLGLVEMLGKTGLGRKLCS